MCGVVGTDGNRVTLDKNKCRLNSRTTEKKVVTKGKY